MQMKPLQVKNIEQKINLHLAMSLKNKIYKAIYISVSHFTIATELRLIAKSKCMDSTQKKSSK